MKIMMKLLIVMVLIVAVAFGGAFFYVDSIAKKAIEQGGEMALGVPTRLDDLNISIFGGKTELSGLQVSNPTGFSAPVFMALGQGDVAISLKSLLGDTLQIPHVRLSGIRVNLEQSGKKNNVEPILARIRSLASQQGESKTAAASDSGKKFVIDYFSLDDVQVNANLELLGQVSKVKLTLPKIELRNLGDKEQGLPMAELVQKVVQAVLSTVQNSSTQLSPALAKLLARELADLEGIKTEVIGKARAEVEKKGQEVKQQVEDKLKQVVPATPLTEDLNKAVEEKAGSLLKGVLGGKK